MTLQLHQVVAKELYQMPPLLMRYFLIIVIVIIITIMIMIMIIKMIIRPRRR